MKRIKDELLVTEMLLSIHRVLAKYGPNLKLKQANRILKQFNLKIGMTYGNQKK
jgi:hypothetical protein